MKNTTGETAYACRDGELVHVSQVPRGMACGCTCPKCNGALIARKGLERAHHFAHLTGSICLGAAETILHILGKTILTEIDCIQLPPYEYRRDIRIGLERARVFHEEIIARGGELVIDRVELEKSLIGFRPDAILFRNNKQLLVEIAVTHKVGKKKKRRLQKQDNPAIEISLALDMSTWSKDKIKEFIQLDMDSKKWLFHPRELKAQRHFREKVRQSVAQSRAQRLMSENHQYGHVQTRSSLVVPDFGHGNELQRKQEFVIQQFYRSHDRYPSKEETLQNWPELFAVKS